MVELVRAGRTPRELALEFECSVSAIRNWVRQADRDEGLREDGLEQALQPAPIRKQVSFLVSHSVTRSRKSLM